jgi:hypothetical protein
MAATGSWAAAGWKRAPHPATAVATAVAAAARTAAPSKCGATMLWDEEEAIDGAAQAVVVDLLDSSRTILSFAVMPIRIEDTIQELLYGLKISLLQEIDPRPTRCTHRRARTRATARSTASSRTCSLQTFPPIISGLVPNATSSESESDIV